MNKTRKTVVVVDSYDLEKALEAQGVEYDLLGDWFCYQDFGSDCYMDLGQWRDIDELNYDDPTPEDIKRAFCHQVLKDMFGDEEVWVHISY